MRDPGGRLRFEEERVVRELVRPLDSKHFLRSPLSQRWVADKRMVEFEEVDAFTLASPRLSFVSLPSEWCDAQLFEAGQLSLQLEQEAVETGFSLKDASAWNVIFDGTRPVFCDLLSFERVAEKKWWAAGQFARHFLFTQLMSRRSGLHCCTAFRTWRDGVPADVIRHTLGMSRFLTRHWPLMIEGGRTGVGDVDRPAVLRDEAAIVRFRQSLLASFGWMLAGTRPRARRRNATAPWLHYVNDRPHYSEVASLAKRAQVHEWLDRTRPEFVADFGCNTGEFSRMALSMGASVIALDADHDSIERLFLDHPSTSGLHAIVAPLDDLQAGRGWAGSEHPGLPERLHRRFDLVMMLALIHHLAIAAGIPLEEIAAFARGCTRRWLVVEFIEANDPQLQLLCGQRRRDPNDFTLSRQRRAFLAAGFELEAELALDGGTRTLALLRGDS